ncbi:MAG: hypothetical protein FJ316_05790 [SAR202 cluster bacterium]|nr:hypothetical protein [SAR202 cluster bacterium]
MKKFFLTTTLAALLASATIGISVAVFGEFEGLQKKLLLTMLVVAGFSVTGLISASREGSGWLNPLSFLGAIASLAALGVVVLLIWGMLVQDQRSWQVVATVVVVALTLGHMAYLLGVRPAGGVVRLWWGGAVLLSLVMAGLLMVGILQCVDPLKRSTYIKLLAVVAILDALATVALGLLAQLMESPGHGSRRTASRRRA